MRFKLFSISTCVLSLFISVQGATGDLDCSFGFGGKATTALGGLSGDIARDVAVQPDGKIVVVGGRGPSSSPPLDSVIIRYNPNGTLDTTFDSDGILILAMSPSSDEEARAVAIQPDGKIVVAGYAYTGTVTAGDFYVIRLNSDGSFDSSFDGDGKTFTDFNTKNDLAFSLILQADGKIIVGGDATNSGGNFKDFALARYNPDGSLDTSFDSDGKVVTVGTNSDDHIFDVTLQTDGKIVAVGNSFTGINTDFAVLRYNADGSPDTSFDGDGKLITVIGGYEGANSVAIQPDGKIVLTGDTIIGSYEDIALIRYNTDGSLDTSFDTDGKVTTAIGTQYDLGTEIFAQADGKLLVVGHTFTNKFNFVLLRYNSNGSLDTSFHTTGYVVTPLGTIEDKAHAGTFLPDGKVVAVGSAYSSSTERDFAVVRYTGEQAVVCSAPFDFDGDSKADLSIFRPSVGEWWYLKSSNGGNYAAQFGSSTDKLTPGDFTADGKTDIAFWRPSTGEWFVLRSEDSSYYSYPFGTSGDVPVVGDFDGDFKADTGVYRPSNLTWFIRRSSDGGATIQQFGANGDLPVVADYDGDGKSDIAIYRPSVGEWWLNRSTAGVIAFQFGNSADKPTQGDFTGDGKADVAFWRPSTGEWFVLRSENQSYYSFPFGNSTDVAAAGDYDGDRKFDAAIFRPSTSTWYVQRSTAGTLIQGFGQSGDMPVPNAFVP
jgi:uncharacterized delta-60 repeat protein